MSHQPLFIFTTTTTTNTPSFVSRLLKGMSEFYSFTNLLSVESLHVIFNDHSEKKGTDERLTKWEEVKKYEVTCMATQRQSITRHSCVTVTSLTWHGFQKAGFSKGRPFTSVITKQMQHGHEFS